MKKQKPFTKSDVKPTDSEIQQLIEKTKEQYKKYQEINSSLNSLNQPESVDCSWRTMDHPLTITFKSS